MCNGVVPLAAQYIVLNVMDQQQQPCRHRRQLLMSVLQASMTEKGMSRAVQEAVLPIQAAINRDPALALEMDQAKARRDKKAYDRASARAATKAAAAGMPLPSKEQALQKTKSGYAPELNTPAPLDRSVPDFWDPVGSVRQCLSDFCGNKCPMVAAELSVLQCDSCRWHRCAPGALGCTILSMRAVPARAGT